MARLPRTSVARLIDAAARFAARQPALAGMLGTGSADPDLERVREGIFFLGAAVTDQISRFEQDGYAALAEIAAGDLARPFPAASIAQLTTKGSQIVHVHHGAELHPRGVPHCRFAVVGALDVGPVQIENCRVEGERRLSLRFELVAQSDAPLSLSVTDTLRLFIDEPREIALLLLAHILSHTRRVDLRREGGETVSIRGIRRTGARTSDALAGEPDGIDMGSSLIREYYLLPERFLLLDLLGAAEALGKSADRRATIIMRFDAPVPQRVLVTPEGIRAHAAPVANLFRTTAEPAVFEPGNGEFSVRVAGLSRAEAGPYAILSVTSTKLDADAGPVNVPPLRRFGAVSLDPSFPYVFGTRLVCPRPGDEPETVVSLTRAPDTLPVVADHAISLELLATNRHLGASVRPGELSEPGRGMPRDIRARNIVATSPYIPALAGSEFALRTFARAEVPRRDPLHVLQSLLYSLIPSHSLPLEAGRALRARVRAVERADVDIVSNTARTRRGYRLVLTLDETPFDGLGDVALFCRVIHEVLEARASLNRFFRCEVVCTKSGSRVAWPPEGRS